MIANFGFGALVIAFLVSLYGIFAAIYGAQKKAPAWVDSARNAMLLTWPLLTLTALSIIYLLVNNHYEVQYVTSVTSNSMPLYLKVTALWGGQAGSLIFWSWLMSAFASAVTLRKWKRDREFLPWVIVVSLVTWHFHFSQPVCRESFVRLWIRPGKCSGNVRSQEQRSSPTRWQGLNPSCATPA
jgi:cytochrome c-type biogenesis protein CcmF